MTALYQRMLEDMQLRGLATTTQRSYLHYVTEYARHFWKSPSDLDLDAVRQWILYLTEQRKLSPESVNTALAALKFCYQRSLEMPWRDDDFPRRQPVPAKTPTVLSQTEVMKFFEAAAGLKYRTIAMLCYGAGLRIQEAVTLQSTNIDSARMVLQIEHGKGNKDRVVALSPRLLEVLRAYYREFRPATAWLFPGFRNESHVNQGSVQQAFRDALNRSGLRKRVTPHTLRHSFATHLLESGEDIRVIQALLGHTRIDTTAHYASVTPARLAKVAGPLDRLTASAPRKRGRPRKQAD